MKIKKIVQIFSNGSLNFSYKIYNDLQFINFYNKDNKNFYLNAKKQINQIKNSDFFNYKIKYINKN
jgi:hypothetical protein